MKSTFVSLPMALENLSDPLPGESPAGQDCESEIQSQNLGLMTEYLVARAVQKVRERAADASYSDQGEALNAAAQRDEGKTHIASLEGILKDVLKLSSINPEQVAKALRDKGSALLARRGKDLRVMPHLGASCTLIEGLDGYLAACRLAVALLKTYPESLFPLPDPDDAAAFWQRDNAISDLVSGEGICALLGQVIVLDARQSGRLALAELVGGLRGDLPVSEVSDADLSAALAEVGPDRVRQLSSDLRDIEASFAEMAKAFPAGALSVPRLAETFRRATSRIAAVSGAGAASETATATDSNASMPVEAQGAKGIGVLRSREDVRRTIQELILCIEKLEPGHPAPLLLRRAHRLLGMSFFDIIRDMAPAALSDIERIAGTESSR